MTNVLQGITVLDLSTGIAGAVAGMFLSDNGAKVNRTTYSDKPNERNNPGFHVWDRGKHKIDIDVCKSLEEFLVHSESSKERILEQSELGKFCEQVKNSDILIHEATFSHEKLERAVKHFHTTNIQAMEIADKAQVKRLILTHFSLRLSNEDIRDWVWNGQPCVIFDERQEI